jgi:hypothetical protein
VLVALKCSYAIWDYIMTKFYEEKEITTSLNTPYLPNILQVLNEVEHEASYMAPLISSEAKGRVTNPELSTH